MRMVSLAMLAVTVLNGCTGPSLEREDALAGACQFKPCVCADENAPFWRKPSTVDLIWNEDGTPSCPPGFALQRAEGGGRDIERPRPPRCKS